MAPAIMMDGGSEIVMDGGSGNGQQWQCNGRRDGRAIAMSNEMAAAQDDCRQCRSSTMGVWYFRLVFIFA
jgi:hypothetical protein